jgi:hypothetical protein
VALEAVLAQLVAHGLVRLLVEQAAQVSDGVLVHGQALDEVLVVHAHTQALVAAHLTLRGLQLVRDQLDDGTARKQVGNRQISR